MAQGVNTKKWLLLGGELIKAVTLRLDGEPSSVGGSTLFSFCLLCEAKSDFLGLHILA